MPSNTSSTATKWVLYTWPDATFSAIEVPIKWRYTEPLPPPALASPRFSCSYDAVDILLRARAQSATTSQ